MTVKLQDPGSVGSSTMNKSNTIFVYMYMYVLRIYVYFNRVQRTIKWTLTSFQIASIYIFAESFECFGCLNVGGVLSTTSRLMAQVSGLRD